MKHLITIFLFILSICAEAKNCKIAIVDNTIYGSERTSYEIKQYNLLEGILVKELEKKGFILSTENKANYITYLPKIECLENYSRYECSFFQSELVLVKSGTERYEVYFGHSRDRYNRWFKASKKEAIESIFENIKHCEDLTF